MVVSSASRLRLWLQLAVNALRLTGDGNLRFSITQMLYAMIGFALAAAIIAAGTKGSVLAYGIGVSICMLVLYFLFFAVLYWTASIFSGSRKPPVELVAEVSEEPQV